jgi:hypothetical protein
MKLENPIPNALKEKGKNKILWWNNRSVLLRTASQYAGESVQPNSSI